MIRLRIVMSGLYGSTAIIHPIWVIEEYARILRSWVWFSPPQPPTRIDRIERVRRMFVSTDEDIWYIIEMGANFCHVRRSKPDVRGTPWVTSGTQKWKGAIPSFIAREVTIIRDEYGLVVLVVVHCPESMLL